MTSEPPDLLTAREVLESAVASAQSALDADVLVNGTDVDLGQAITDAQSAIDARHAATEAVDLAQAAVDARDALHTQLANANNALVSAPSAESLEDTLVAAQALVSERAALLQEVADAQKAIDDLNDLKTAVTNAQSAHSDHAGTHGNVELKLDVVKGIVEARPGLEAAVQTAQTNLDARADLQNSLDLAKGSLDAHIADHGTNEVVDDAVITLQDLLAVRSTLEQAVTDAEAGIDVTESDSFFDILGNTHDQITNFTVGQDLLALDVSGTAEDVGATTVNGVTFSITNGVASLDGTYDVADTFGALATYLADQNVAVAVSAHGDTYVLGLDGVTGLDMADTFVVLVGTQVKDLTSILA